MSVDQSADLPFSAEYAKSNRAGCKLCSMNIVKDTLRLAVMVQSPHFDGKVPNWYHFACFWSRAKVKTFEDIHGFNSLRWEDQQKIKEKISSGDEFSGKGSKTYKDYTTEYAKSGQSTCRGCENKIEKKELRLSRKDYESQRSKMYGPQDLWYHVDCFVSQRDELEFTADKDPTKITGFVKLVKADQNVLLQKLGKGQKNKRKADGETSQASKKSKVESEEDKALREQSHFIYQFRDSLQKEVSLDAMRLLLEYNKQKVVSGESRLLDCVSDTMAFGALEPCPECGGQVRFSGSSNGYRCSGNITEWANCIYFTVLPKRRPFKVPKEFHDVAFLKKYKYVPRDRVLSQSTDKTVAAAGAGSSGSSSVPAQSNGTGKPLSGMSFAVVGKVTQKKAELVDRINELGGKISRTIESTTACISTQDEVQKMGKAMTKVKENGVRVVDEAFLEAVDKSNLAVQQLLTQHSIGTWTCKEPIPIKSTASTASKSSSGKSLVSAKDAYFTKSVPMTMKMTVKGGAAVDPDSGLTAKAHVLQESKNEIYNAVLGMVDILKGTNSYYKLQVLESDKKIKWWVFRAWGRVGTTIGGNKLESFGSKANAVEHFCSLYEEKTGNEWADRANFTKVAKKFYPLDIDYGGSDEVVRKLEETDGSRSSLPSDVQSLIRLIFDVESMKKAMLEFEIDLTKMPLGKLSRKQIESAYKILTDLQQLIQQGGTKTQFLDASNRFYTLIPHDFGMKKPPLLDTLDEIKVKTDMLDNLLDIEIGYSMMRITEDDSATDPLDAHYKKLKADIQVLEKACEDYERLEKYVKNTHAATHQHYELEIINIFKVDRQGEAKTYRPFRDLHNRKLLWHGSRTTNFAGILSQGLRIAPPEAPVTGYMFGKGIYFADMVSKSANYCHTSKSDPVGLLLLSEVALGNMHELVAAENITKLPKNKHSVKGCGMTHPDPADVFQTPDGVEIPFGKPVERTENPSSLLYNEYIVYDVAQVNLKYLLQVNFKYKW